MPISQLSDDQLRQMVAQKRAQPTNDFSNLSDEALRAEVEKKRKSPSDFNTGLRDLATLTSRDLTLGAAPLAAGIGAGAGAFSGTKGDLGEKWKAGKEAFFEGRGERHAEEEAAAERNPNLSKITTVAGLLATAPLAAGASAAKVGAGLGLVRAGSEGESLADIPGMALQGAGLGYLGGKAGEYAAKGISKGAGLVSAGAKKLAETAPGQLVGRAVKQVGRIPSRAMSALTGAAEKDITNYWNKTKEINQLIDEGIPGASDRIRNEFAGEVRNYRQGLNSKITEALKQEGDVLIDPNNITAVLDGAKAKLNSKFDQEAIKGIDEMSKRIGTAESVSDLFAAKEWLQDMAKGQYVRNGQIFTTNDKTARAAKAAANEARKLLNFVSPEIKGANNQLARLHQIEDQLTRTILKEGSPEASLLAAGRGANPRNEKLLKELGEKTGYPILGKAEELASAKTFGEAKLDPFDTTGKSAFRLLAGGGAGGMLGGPTGAAIGAAATSPAALKLGINAAQVPRAIAMGAGGLLKDGAQGFLKSDLPAAAGAIGGASQGNMETTRERDAHLSSLVEEARNDPKNPYHGMIAGMSDDYAKDIINMQEGLASGGAFGMLGNFKGPKSNLVPLEQLAERRGFIKPNLENQQAQNALDNLAKAKDPKDIEGLGLIAQQKMGLLENNNGELLRPPTPPGQNSQKTWRRLSTEKEANDFKSRALEDTDRDAILERQRKLYRDDNESFGERKARQSAEASKSKKDNVLKLPSADDQAIKQPSSPGDSHEATMESLRNRYGDNPPATMLRAEELSKKGHDEPYAFGDIGNVVWRKGNRDAVYQKGGDNVWNGPMPFPTKTGDLKGVLGKGVPNANGPDPFMWMDDKYKSTKRALDANYDKPLEIHTRSDLIAKPDYMERINPEKHKINIHVAGDNDRVNRILEPGVPSFKRRMAAVKALAEKGFDVTIVHDDMMGNFKGEPEFGGATFKDTLKGMFDINPMALRKEHGLKNVKFSKNKIKLDKEQLKKIEEATGMGLRGFKSDD